MSADADAAQLRPGVRLRRPPEVGCCSEVNAREGSLQHRRMAFVYHAVPAAMVGSVLYPLSDLGRVAPRVADLQRLKYVGREGVLQTAITSTGLLFNDTVHCAPVHPYHLYAARRDLDLLPQAEMTDRARKNQRLFFEITLERIVIHPTCWYRWVTPWVNGYPAANVALAPPLDELSRLIRRATWT